MSVNRKKTSAEISQLASETLRNKNASQIAKSLAASALAQSSSSKQTGADMETKASNVLKSNKYNDE